MHEHNFMLHISKNVVKNSTRVHASHSQSPIARQIDTGHLIFNLYTENILFI